MLKLHYNRAARVKFPGSTRNRDHGNLRVPPQCHRLRKKSLLKGYYPLCFLGVGGIVRAILKFPWQDDSVFLVFLLCSEVLPFWGTEVTPQKTEHDNGTTNHLEMYLLLSKMVDFFPAIAMLVFSGFRWLMRNAEKFSGYLIGPSTEVPFPSMDLHPAAVVFFSRNNGHTHMKTWWPSFHRFRSLGLHRYCGCLFLVFFWFFWFQWCGFLFAPDDISSKSNAFQFSSAKHRGITNSKSLKFIYFATLGCLEYESLLEPSHNTTRLVLKQNDQAKGTKMKAEKCHSPRW